MSSNMEINKICEWCKKPFKARKTTSKTCSDDCAKRYYNWRKRQTKIELAGRSVANPLPDVEGPPLTATILPRTIQTPTPVPEIEQELLTITNLASVTGISEPTLFRMIKSDPAFPKLKIGRLLRFHKPTVLEYIIEKYTVYERTSATKSHGQRKKS